MGKLAVASYDLVAEVDVFQDRYRIISKDDAYSDTPEQEGIYSEWIGDLLNTRVVPKDKAQVARLLDVHTLPGQLTEKMIIPFLFRHRRKGRAAFLRI